MNLASLARDNLEQFGEYVSLIYEDDTNYEECTNKELYDTSDGFARALVSLGVQPGDLVSVILPNSPYVVKTFQAILKIGATINPIIFALSQDEFEYILKDATPACIITAPELYDKVRASGKDAGYRGEIVVVGDPEIPGALSFERLVEQHAGSLDIVETADDDLAIVMYTSGTTGVSKGVMLTHGNLHFITTTGIQLFPSTPESTALCVLPLNHSYGVTLMNNGYLTGAQMVLHPWFDPEKTLTAIAEHRVTQFPGVPTMYLMLLNTYDPEVHDTSSIEDLVVSAAPMPAGLLDTVEQRLGGKIYEGYGLTEAAPSVSIQRRGQPRKRGSVGSPLPGVSVKIVDEEDQEAPRGTWGEIVVRGPNVMKGYLNKPKETAEALRNGWLHTGDIGYMDDDGEIYITDRKKDLIIRGGENISPSEIEEVLFKHPDILEAAVIGVADPVYGEEIKAVVVPKSGQTLTADAVIDFCQKRLARFRCPKSVDFAEALPKNPVGKVLKRELRKQFSA